MSQTISVSTTMGEQGFRDLPCSMHSITAKHGCVPLFLPPSCCFAAVCLSQLGSAVPGCWLLCLPLWASACR